MSARGVFVGVDVAKDALDVAVRPSDERWSVANDEADVAALVARLRPLQPTLVGCGATGGFEHAAVGARAAGRLPEAGANPRQVRAFARAGRQRGPAERVGA